MPKDQTPLLDPYASSEAAHSHGPPGADVYYSQHKLLLVNANDSSIRMEALFNPQQLVPAITVVAGRLHPVGWSHPIKQYAYTNEVSFTLQLVFTRMAMMYPGSGYGARKVKESNASIRASVRDPVAWLTSFCYGPAKGKAPDPIYVIWPKTMNLLCTVDSVTPTFKRWATDGEPLEVSVSVKFSELRKEFKTSLQQDAVGFQNPDRSAVRGMKMSGAPASGTTSGKRHDHG
jgi:hypothetical protein